MTKALLSLLLATTQLFSWSGPALWLCLCGSGEACIVGNPQTCKCCQQHHPEGTPCRDAGSGHDDGRRTSDQLVSDGDDDLFVRQPAACPHFQLSYHQNAVVSASFAHDDADMIPLAAETARRASVIDASACDGRTAAVWRSRALRLPSADLACVVLQC